MTELEAISEELDERIESLADNLEEIPRLFAKAYNSQQWTLEEWRTWCDARRLGRLPREVRELWDEVLKPAGLTSGYRAAAYGGASNSQSPSQQSRILGNPSNSNQPTRNYGPVPDHDVDAETRDWKASQPGNNQPLPELSMTPDQAEAEWISTLTRILADMASLAKGNEDRGRIRAKLHELVDRSFQ